MPPRRNRNVPCQFKTGDRIRVIAMFEHHDSHLENLRMRPCVESRLITGIPNLAEAIRNKLPEVEAALRTCQEAAKPSDDDDDAILNSLLDE